MLLQVNNLTVSYGGIRAIDSVSFGLEAGELLVLIGPNGAGKTTILRAITGLKPPDIDNGTVWLDGQDITGEASHQIVRRGIALAPEGRQIFGRLTVLENLKLATFARGHDNQQQFQDDLEWIYGLFPILKERGKQKAGTLSGGEQQMLCIGRALVSRPSVLLLDEPSLGLAPKLVESIFRVVHRLHMEGTTILLVEQNALLALQVANRGLVLENGSIVMQDSGEALLRSREVQEHYLGKRKELEVNNG